MNAFRNKRPIQNGRTISVGNECEGAPECIELHIEVVREDGSNPTWVEAHMKYADAAWLRDQLKTALVERKLEDSSTYGKTTKAKGSKKRKKSGTIKDKRTTTKDGK